MAGREGTTLGPYRLAHLLGAGGAGEVYLAEGPVPSRERAQVAIKVVRGSASHPTTQAIARQAQAIAGLHPPHVLPVHAVAEAGGALYIAMDYAAAGSLARTIGGAEALHLPLGAGTVARLVTQVARALQPLHAQGVVHGDLKLTNLFVRTSPQGGPLAAASDFGQSVVLDTAVGALRQGGPAAASDPTLAEALRCAAPEQVSGQHLPASDQYALATIAYFLLTGRYPFEGDAYSLASALVQSPVTPPTQIDPTLPPTAEAALLRALSKDPAARHADVAAFAQALGDGLASAVLSGNATQQFRYLSGASPAVSGVRQVGTASPRSASGVRAGAVGSAGSGVRRAGPLGASGIRQVPGVSAPAGTLALLSRSPKGRILAAAAVAMVVVLAITSVFALRALFSAAPTAQTPLPQLGGLNYAPTVTPDATAIARTHARAASGLALLKTVGATSPIFSDPLTSNGQHWPIAGTHFAFGADGKLHGTNDNAFTVATVNQPVTPPANYLVTVNMTFLKGTPADVAGLSVRAIVGGASPTARYLALIAPEGRYNIWYFDGTKWSNLANGYSGAIKPGLDVSNTLQVLCDNQEIWLFVNGQFVTDVRDFTPPGATDSLGPAVVYSSTEVAYDHYAVYQANN